MENGLSPEEQKAAGIILPVIFVIAIAIIVSKQLFPLFLVGFVLFLVGAIISLFIGLSFRDHSYTEWYEYVTIWLFGIALLCAIGTGITYFIGYGIGGTLFGQASLEVYYALTGAEQEISNALKTSINQVVKENCKILPEESCDLLK